MLKRISQKLLIEMKKYSKKNVNAINWAIIGTGPMSNFFCKALTLSNNATIYSVVSRDISKARSFARRYNVTNYYGNIDKMLTDPNVDIVYIGTPVHTHYDIAEKCINAKKNVLLEKPLASTYKEASQLIKIAQNNNVLLVEGLWSKFLPTIKKVKEITNNKKLGNLNCLRCDLSKNVIIDTDRTEFSQKYGGVLYDYGIYPISFALEFLEEDYSIERCHVENNHLNIDSSWDLILKDNELKAHITISSQYLGSQSCVFYFEKGKIVLPGQFNRTNEIHYYDLNNNLIKVEKFSYKFEGFEYQIREVHECLELGKNESNSVSYDSTLQIHELMTTLKGLA